MAIDLSDYTFADFGASNGGSLKWASEKFGGRGLGIDLDPAKIASLKAKGFDCVEADITTLDVADNSVKYVVMMDFLEHLPSVELAKKCVDTAVRIASEFVYIVGPDFSHADYLKDHDLIKYYADWSGHTLHHTPKEFGVFLSGHKTHDTRVVQFERMYDSFDQAVLPVVTPRNHGVYNPESDAPKKYLAFDRKIYRRIMGVINKGQAVSTEQIILRGLGVHVHGQNFNKPFFAGSTTGDAKAPAAPKAAKTKAAPKEPAVKKKKPDVEVGVGRPVELAERPAASGPASAPADMRNVIFVCGVGRSGTSALTELLNHHPDVVVGFERYKNRYKDVKKPDDLSVLFREDRFFGYQPEDTNNTIENGKYDEDYRRMRQRFPSAQFVGDKMPGLYRRFRWMERIAPGAHVVHIVRDPVEVANSWNGRVARGGGWSAANDHTKAVEEWNFALKETLQTLEAGKLKIGVVRYEQLFDSDDDTPHRLIAWLGLKPSAVFDEGVAAVRKRAAELSKTREVPKTVRAYVEQRADRSLQSRLLAVAI